MPILGVAPDGRTLAVALARSSALFLWRAETPERLISVVGPGQTATQSANAPPSATPRRAAGAPDPPALSYRAIQIGPDDRTIYLIDQNRQPHVWGLESKADATEVHARELSWPQSVPIPEGGFIAIALRPDGKILAVADRSGTILLIDTSRRKVVGRIKPPGDLVASFSLPIAFSPDGNSLAVGCPQDGTISIWSVDQPSRPRLRLNLPGHRGLFTLAFDPQGRRLASQGIDPLVEVWDLDLIQRELTQWGLSD
jgi:WD40 repeat protein